MIASPDMWFAATLVVRMLVVAAVVVIASLAVERAGPLGGAMIATLPVSAGPAYVFLAIDHGPVFVAESAVASLLSVAATAAFTLAYLAASARFGTLLSLGAAISGWAATLAVLSARTWTAPEALAVVLATHAVAILVTGPARRQPVALMGRSRWGTVAVRAVSVMILVAVVTVAGLALGPRAAGLAALVPVVFTSLIAILQPRVGPATPRAVMANGLVGMVGYGFALGLLHAAAPSLGSAAGLSLALATCVAWNAAVLGGRRFLARTR